MRIEHDFLGTMSLEDNTLYGIQTVRGVEASGATGQSFSSFGMPFVLAMVRIKKACALANREAGGLTEQQAESIVQACDVLLTGEHRDQFPTDLVTGGGGVSIHMNVNEVLARLASNLGSVAIHPNTHVNMGQSTNDVVPSALLLMAHDLLEGLLGPVRRLEAVCADKEREFAHVVRLGRTCLQDALPVTLGQNFGAWKQFFASQAGVLETLAASCLHLPLGGTAVGTGAGCLPGYAQALYRHLAEVTSLPVEPCANLFVGLQFADEHMRVSAALKGLSAGMAKIAADLRLLSSGPRAGFGELSIPALLPGSSIMPGKINPTIPELVMQVHFLVAGNDTAITLAAERGELELNAWEAVLIKCLLEDARLLGRAMALFADKCLAGVEADAEHCLAQAERSTALAALVSAVFGYETGEKAARMAMKEGCTMREACVALGLLDAKSAGELLDPALLTDSERMAATVARFRTDIAARS